MSNLNSPQELPRVSPSQPLICHPSGYFLSLPQARQLQLSTDLNEPPDHWLHSNAQAQSHPRSPHVSPTPGAADTAHSPAQHKQPPTEQFVSQGISNASPADSPITGKSSVIRPPPGLGPISSNAPPGLGPVSSSAPPGLGPVSSSAPPGLGPVSSSSQQLSRAMQANVQPHSSALVPRVPSDVADVQFAGVAEPSHVPHHPSFGPEPCVLEPTTLADKIPPSFGKLLATVPSSTLKPHPDEASDILNSAGRFTWSDLPPASSLIAEAHPDAVGKVDIIGSAEAVKSLLEAPYSDTPLSLAVHRVDRTLLVDSLDLSNLYRAQRPPAGAAFDHASQSKPSSHRQQSSSSEADFSSSSSHPNAAAAAPVGGKSHHGGLLGVMQEAVKSDRTHVSQRVLRPVKKDSEKARSRKLFSKFMAHSLAAPGDAEDEEVLPEHADNYGLSYPQEFQTILPSASPRLPTADSSSPATNVMPSASASASASAAASAAASASASASASAAASSAAVPVRKSHQAMLHSASDIAKWKAQHRELMSGEYDRRPSLSSSLPSSSTAAAAAAGGGSSSADSSFMAGASSGVKGTGWLQPSHDIHSAAGSISVQSQAETSSLAGRHVRNQVAASLARPTMPEAWANASHPAAAAPPALPSTDSDSSVVVHDGKAGWTAPASATAQAPAGAAAGGGNEEEDTVQPPVQCSVPLKPRPVAVGSFGSYGMVHPDSGVTSSSTIYNMGWQWPFSRHVEWVFKDLRMLLGTNMPIFGCGKYPAVSLKLVDVAQRIDVLTGIDYWLDNLMCGVPDLVMCFHLNGVVKGYDWHKTMDLPNLAASSFNPELISDVANNIYNFLYRTTAQEGHTYWLCKDRDDDFVRVYDLTAICFRKPGRSTADNPYTIPVAMLLYRTAKYWMFSEHGKMTTSRTRDIFELLKNTIHLLQGDTTCPEVQVSALYLLSTLCVDRRNTTIADGSPVLLIEEPNFDEADGKDPADSESPGLSPPSTPPTVERSTNESDADGWRQDGPKKPGDGETMSDGREVHCSVPSARSQSCSSVTTTVQSIDVLLKSSFSKRKEKDKHPSPPPPNTNERIQQTIELIEEGLLMLSEWQSSVAIVLSSVETISGATRSTGSSAPGNATAAAGLRSNDQNAGVTVKGMANITTATASNPAVGKQYGLVELLHQHTGQADPSTPQPTASTSKRKGKKKRAASKKDSVPEVKSSTGVSLQDGQQPHVGSQHASTNADDALLASESQTSHEVVDIAKSATTSTAGVQCEGCVDTGEAKPMHDASCTAVDISGPGPLVSGADTSRRGSEDSLRSRAHSFHNAKAEQPASSDAVQIDLRLDSVGAVHEDLCSCSQPWFLHATLLLCNQAGLAMHGLASDSLKTEHAGRALRYLNIAAACFQVGERLLQHLCSFKCPEAAKITSFSANAIAVMALKVQAFDALRNKGPDVTPLSFERHAEEYAAQACGDRLTAWLKQVLPNQSCFHPVVLTNDADILGKEIHDVCCSLMQVGLDIPSGLARTCVCFAAQACHDVSMNEMSKISGFLVQATLGEAQNDHDAVTQNLSVARLTSSSADMSSLQTVADALERVEKFDQAVACRRNMAHCVFLRSVVEYPSFFLYLPSHYQSLALADQQTQYKHVLDLMSVEQCQHEKGLSVFNVIKSSAPKQLQSRLVFSNLFILLCKACFMVSHKMLGTVAVDFEPVMNLLHSVDEKIKQAFKLSSLDLISKAQLDMATCLVHLSRAAFILETLREMSDPTQAPARRKSPDFLKAKFMSNLNNAKEHADLHNDAHINVVLVRVRLDFLYLSLKSEKHTADSAYSQLFNMVGTCVSLQGPAQSSLDHFKKTPGADGAGVDSLLCLQGCDGRAGLLAFLSVAHLSKKCRHSRMQSILCDFNDVHVCLLDVLQKLARIQSRNENRRAEEPDWKRLYGRALKGRRIFDGANLVIEKVTAFLEDFVSLLSDLASEMERVLKRLGSSA